MGALQAWGEVVKDQPSSRDLLDYGSLLHSLYLFHDAGGVFKELLAHPDSTADELLSVAKQLSSRANYDESLKFTHQACQLKPESREYSILYASCLERSGNEEAAAALLILLLESYPNQARAVRLLAHIERRGNKFEDARMRMMQFLNTFNTPDNWRVQYELAGVLDRLGDYDEAMGVLLKSKAAIQSLAQEFYPSWRAVSERQWEVTQRLDSLRLDGWSDAEDRLQPEFRLCLLAGFPRSGTTLLEQVIGTSSECIGTDETGILASQFRDPIILQAESADEALAELESFDAEELVPLRLFPESKIIMPLRDPRDVVVSFFFTIVPLSSGSVAAISLEDSCRYYAEVMRHWLYLREVIPPERWMESRYEDLLAEPEKQTRAIARFLGIEWTSDMLAHHKKKPEKTISTPTYDDVSKPLYTRSKGRWRNYETYLKPHLHHLEPYINAFGYEASE